MFLSFDRMRALRLLVVVILVLCIVFSASVGQYAHALVLESTLFAVVATILIGSGVIASSDADLDAVVSDFYNSLDKDNAAAVAVIASKYAEASTGSFSFKVSQGIVNAVADWLAAKEWGSFDDSGVGGFSVAGGSQAIFQGLDFSSIFMPDYTYKLFITAYHNGNYPTAEDAGIVFLNSPSSISDVLLNKWIHVLSNGSGDYFLFIEKEGETYYCNRSFTLDGSISARYVISSIAVFSSDGSPKNYAPYCIVINGQYGFLPFEYAGASGSVTTFPQANVQSNTTYFPQEAVSSAAGSTTEFPANAASQPLTTELPLTIPADGVNSTTGALDVRVPATDVPDTPDVPATSFWDKLWDWLQKIIDTILSVPAAIGQAITSAISWLFDAISGLLTDLFVPDLTACSDTLTVYQGKFQWVPDLFGFVKNFFDSLLCDEPPKIPIYLNKSEGSFDFGGKEYILDMSWYARYKGTVDTLLSGILWVFFLWRLFKRLPDILAGVGMATDPILTPGQPPTLLAGPSGPDPLTLPGKSVRRRN